MATYFHDKIVSAVCRSIGVFCFLMLFACSGENASDFQREAQKLLQEENAAGAVVFLVNALEKEPTNFSVRLDLAKAYLKLGKLPQAEAEFQKCLRQKPDDPELRVAMGRFFIQTRKPEDALRHLDAAETALKPTAESRELAALAYSMLNRLPEAEAALDQALLIDPEAKSASVSMARLYLVQQRSQEALELTEKLLKENPSFAEALRLRVRIALQEDDPDTAVTCCRKLMEVAPDDVGSQYLLGTLLLQKNDVHAAEAVRNRLRSGGSETPGANMLDGLISYQKNMFKEAAAFFQKSLELSPSVEGYYRLGSAQSRLGDNESALSSLQRALDISPRHGAALQLRARILLDQRRVDDALREVEKLTGYYPENASVHYLRGLILKAKGDSGRAGKALQRALELNPAMTEATTVLSSILIAEKRFEEVESELTKGLQANSGNISAWLALFNYYSARGDTNRAEQTLVKGMAELPNNPALLTLRASLDIDRKKTGPGLAALEKVKEIDPDFLPALNLAIRFHALSGQPARALEICDAYLARNPDAVDQIITSALLLESMQRKEEAAARLQKAYSLGEMRAFYMLVQRDMDSGRLDAAEKRIQDEFAQKTTPALRSYFAQFYVSSGKVDKALSLYDAIRAENPEEAALGKFRMLTAARQYEQALEQARALALLAPNSVLSSVCIADALEHLGRSEEALAELQHAYEKSGEPPLLIALAQFCTRAGQFDKADAFYRTALTQNPNNSQALAGRGGLLMRNRKFDAAVEHYEQALDQSPNNVALLNNLAMAYAESGRNMGKAVSLAMDAYARMPENPEIVDTLAFCLLREKRTDEALVLLEDAVTRLPDNPSIRYRYGEALIQAGQKDKGREALTKALELGSFPDADAAREHLRSALR